MKANNEELFAKLIEDVERAGTFTKIALRFVKMAVST